MDGTDGSPYRFAPVTPGTLDDLERFSCAYGKFRYCSCMRWRLRSTPFREAGNTGRAEELARRVRAGEPVGVLAYTDDAAYPDDADSATGDTPVGWCSVAPRDSYAAVLASQVIPRVPGERVWSVVCFFLAPQARRRFGLQPGLQRSLLRAACGYAASEGAGIVEAYPWPGGASYRYMGTREMYLAAGFEKVPVPVGARPVMRRDLSRPDPAS